MKRTWIDNEENIFEIQNRKNLKPEEDKLSGFPQLISLRPGVGGDSDNLRFRLNSHICHNIAVRGLIKYFNALILTKYHTKQISILNKIIFLISLYLSYYIQNSIFSTILRNTKYKEIFIIINIKILIIGINTNWIWQTNKCDECV